MDNNVWKIGANYFIRCVTFHYTGQVVCVTPYEVVIEKAAWIADSGRFADALVTGKFQEVEPYPDGPVIINRSAIVDASLLATELPREQV